MWWCCGKKDREAPGCRYSKHASRGLGDDSDEEEEGEGTEVDRGKKAMAEAWKLDPNIRSRKTCGQSEREEVLRIL